MYKGFLFVSLISIYFNIRADNGTKEIDSLTSLLNTSLADTARVDIFVRLAFLHYNTDIRTCLGYGQQAMELANAIHYITGEERALSILNNAQRMVGHFSVALEFNLRQITLIEKLKDTLRLIDGYTSLGNIYIDIENFQEAKHYFNKAYELGKKHEVENLSSIMNFSARAYTRTGEYDSAIYWIGTALEREKKTSQNDHTLSYIYNNMAEAYFYKQDYRQAIRHYTLAKNLPAGKTSPFGMTYTLNGLAQAYLELKNYGQAKEAALKSIAISQSHSYRNQTKESYRILHRIYERSGDYENALEYYKLFNLHEDSIFSEDKLQYIENLRIYFETEHVAQENELLRKDAELKDVRIKQSEYFSVIAMISAVSLAVILLFLYQNYRQKQNTNKILSDYNKNLEHQVDVRTRELVKTNMELIRQNGQLEQFGYIIAHNLRAPVARILGLANIINNKNFSMPTDKGILDKLQFAARELDTIIYDLNVILDIKKGIQYSYEEINLAQRLEKVKSILKDKIKDSNLTIVEDFEQTLTCYAIPAYIESILYNLISNSIKYKSAERAPVVQISGKRHHDNFILEVKDNGIGIDLTKTKEKIFSLYQRFHDHVEGKGIGLFLIKTQADAMNGSIEIASEVGLGTSFKIQLPLKKVNVLES